MKGGVRVDQDIKMITVQAGEDNATNVLHLQCFHFRTPLSKPESYWESYPVKWPEINKKIQLAHVGLDHIISANTKEIVHDRSDTSINIKKLSPINVMIGRDGDAKSSKVKQDLNDVQIETTDSWTELTTIAKLDEALDNLTRLWLIM